jgi:hypothetical protein
LWVVPTDDQVRLVPERQYPLVGSGPGYCSWGIWTTGESAVTLMTKGGAAFQRQRQGQAGSSRAALSVVAAGLQGRAGVTRAEAQQRDDKVIDCFPA